MSSAISGSPEGFRAPFRVFFRSFSAQMRPEIGSPGGERGFQCPVITVSGGQAGFKAPGRHLPLEAVKGGRMPQEYVSRGTTGPDGGAAPPPRPGAADTDHNGPDDGLYIHAIEEVHQTKPRMRWRNLF